MPSLRLSRTVSDKGDDRFCILWHCSVALRSAIHALLWRHNDHDGVSNHQPHGCFLNRLLGRGSKKTSKLRVTGLCAGNSSGSVNSPHKGPVTQKMFPFDDVIMAYGELILRVSPKYSIGIKDMFKLKTMQFSQSRTTLPTVQSVFKGCTYHKTETVTKNLGPQFNIKISFYQYRKFHCGDKTVVFLYW